MGKEPVLHPAVAGGEAGQAEAAQEPGIEEVIVQIREDQRGNEAPARRQDAEGLAEDAAGLGDVLQDGEGEDGAELPGGERQAAGVCLDQRRIATGGRRSRQGTGGEVHPHVQPIPKGGDGELSRAAAQVQQGTPQRGGGDVLRLGGAVQRVRQRGGGQVALQHLGCRFHPHAAGSPCRQGGGSHNPSAGPFVHRCRLAYAEPPLGGTLPVPNCDPTSRLLVNARECLVAGALFYSLTSLIAVVGAIAGYELIPVPSDDPTAQKGDLLDSFTNWDGKWYKRIAAEGYRQREPVDRALAFFPAYPLLARWVAQATGMRTELALVVVAHGALLAVFVLTAAYVRRRYPKGPSDALPECVLLALGLTPAAFFFRMAYTESLFVLLFVLALYGMESRWPLVLIALFVGAASAVRAVGVALIPGFLLHVWGRSPGARTALVRMALLAPLAGWGIAAYGLFQLVHFGDPLLFVKAEATFTNRHDGSMGDKFLSDLTGATAWRVFDPSSVHFWERSDTTHNPLFSLSFANPLYFGAGLLLLVLGIRKRWLNRVEATVSVLLLLIPYFTKGYALSMAGTARFTSAVFPLYLVLGNLLVRLPAPLAAGFLAVSGFFLGLYSALFAAWYRFI
jgi:hypothetical protein